MDCARSAWDLLVDFLPGAAGGGTIGAALAIWFSKIWARRFFERDRIKFETQMQTVLQDLRKRGDKELFVHRLQFEKEFEVYVELWKNALRAAQAGIPFRELSFGSPLKYEPGKPPKEVEELREGHNALNRCIYDFRPFYAPAVFDAGKQLLDAVWNIWQRVRDARVFEKKRDEVEENMQRINDELIPHLADAIRNRVFFANGPSGQKQ